MINIELECGGRSSYYEINIWVMMFNKHRGYYKGCYEILQHWCIYDRRHDIPGLKLY